MPFRIISVTGAHSGVGKTTLCSLLLNHLKGFGAIKCTKSPFYTSVTDDPLIIMEKDKDTAILSQSGAEKVVWIQSSGSELENTLPLAMSKMEGMAGVVIEGNSPARLIDTSLVIFIIGGEGKMKPSAGEMSEKADILVINTPENIDVSSLGDLALKKSCRVFRIDLIKKEGEIDKFRAYVKQYIEQDYS